MNSLVFIFLLAVGCGVAVGLTREYFFNDTPSHWDDAETACKVFYKDLATITSTEENNRALQSGPVIASCSWIGIHCTDASSGTWLWSDGETPSFKNWEQNFNPYDCKCGLLNTDNQGSSNQGSSNQGSSNQGSSNQESSNQGSSNQGSSNQESSNQGSLNQGSLNQESSNQGSSNQGSSNQESSNQGSSNQGSLNQGSLNQGSSNQGSSNQESSNQGSSNQESSNQESSNQGSSNQGSSNQESSNQGSSNQGSSNQESSNQGSSNQGLWTQHSCDKPWRFYCYRYLILVQENMTWDEAQEFCRTHYTDLASVTSETSLRQLNLETAQTQTESVWTGLSFMNGIWFWVSGEQLGSLVSVSSCPALPYRCGSLNNKTNTLEKRNCNDRLNFVCYWK